MKLLFCPHCQDVIKLVSSIRRACLCGKSHGECFPDGLHAQIGGAAIPLGIDNNSLLAALESRPEAGDGAGVVAFVIAKQSQTVTDTGTGGDVEFNGPRAQAQQREALLQRVMHASNLNDMSVFELAYTSDLRTPGKKQPRRNTRTTK